MSTNIYMLSAGFLAGIFIVFVIANEIGRIFKLDHYFKDHQLKDKKN
jgi:hypothetical protein